MILVLVALLCVLGARALEPKKKKSGTPAPPDLPAEVNDLARRLYGVPLDESEALTSQIQKLVLDHLQEWIANRAPSDVDVRREMEYAFSKLHYPLFGDPVVFEKSWKEKTLLGAGYTLGWTDYDRVNVIAVFESVGGHTRLATVTPFVPHTDLHYEFIPPSASGEFRFFAYGNRLGKSQLRLTAVLYAFDGQSLKKLWEVHDAYDGKMEVTKDEVKIRYLKEDEYIEAQIHNRVPPRHETVYKVTPAGLEIVADREIAF